MRVFSGKHPGEEKKEEAKKILIDSLREVCQYTNEQGPMEIYMKIFDYDIDKCYLIGHFQDAADVTAVLHKEFSNFGVLSDLSHFPLLREKPEDVIPLVKQYPMNFHIGNCAFRDKRHPGYGDLQPRFGMVGGEIDTPQLRDYFKLLLDLKLLNPDKKPVLSAEVTAAPCGGHVGSCYRKHEARNKRSMGNGVNRAQGPEKADRPNDQRNQRNQ